MTEKPLVLTRTSDGTRADYWRLVYDSLRWKPGSYGLTEAGLLRSLRDDGGWSVDESHLSDQLGRMVSSGEIASTLVDGVRVYTLSDEDSIGTAESSGDAFKPSQVELHDLPLMGTMGRSQVEHAAAVLVRACQILGDVWQPLAWERAWEVVAADVQSVGPCPSGFGRLGLTCEPDLLVAEGYGRRVDDGAIELTERALTAMFLYVRDAAVDGDDALPSAVVRGARVSLARVGNACVAFKPSQVELHDLPLVATMGSGKIESAAAMLVRACQVLGDVWQPLTWAQVSSVMREDKVGRRPPFCDLLENPGFTPCFKRLKAEGYGREADGDAVDLTEKAMVALRAYVVE